jgi:opacity protein-like surface antigen
MTKSIITAIFIMVSIISFGQTFTGKVFNENGEALPGANVILDNNKGAITDAKGIFKIDTTAAQTLTITYIGFEKVVLNFPLDKTKFTLKEGALQLSDLYVTSDQAKTLQHISDYDIKIRPIKTSQDVLRIIPGLFIAQHAGGGKAEQIFLRGFDIDHGTDIALSVDGTPVNMVSHAHGQGYSDLHFVIPETIESVDFNKGPYNAEKGDFATAGYADFQLKNSLDNSSVKLEGGQFGSLRSVIKVKLLDRDKQNESAYIANEVFLSDGYFESPQNFSRINILGKYSRNMTDNTRILGSVSTFSSKWDASGQIPTRAVKDGSISRFGAIDDTEGGKTSRTNINVETKSSLSDQSFWSNQFYFTNYDFKLYSNFTFFLNDPVNGDQITQKEQRNLYGYKTNYAIDYGLGSFDMTTNVGAGFRYDDINDISLSRTKDRTTILSNLASGDIRELNLNSFVSQTAAIGNLKLNLALRLDHFKFEYDDALTNEKLNSSASTVSPKISADYKINNKVSLFAKAGVGFHSNDARVVVANNGKDILPKAFGSDLGFIWKPAPSLVINTAAWILNLDQEFVYVGDEGVVEPSGRTQRKGMDLSIRYQITDWLYSDFDVNVTNPKALDVPEGEDYIPLAPTFTSIGGLSFDFKNGIKGSIRYRYLDDRPANEDYSATATGYYLLDAALTYTRPKFELSLSAENLLNTEWNEAQFETESRLRDEPQPIAGIHYTPGSPFFAKAGVTIFF